MDQILEKLLNGDLSATALIAGLLITLALHLLLRIFNFIVTLAKSVREIDNKKIEHLTKSMEENTKAVYALTADLKTLKDKIIETDVFSTKQKHDNRRIVATIKELAGDRWRDIQKKISEDAIIDGDKA